MLRRYPLAAAFLACLAAPLSTLCAAGPAAGPALSVEALVEEVLARNPSLAQMAAAWQAAQARYPQMTSRDDPIFGAMLGPGSFGSREVDFAYRLEVSQRYPFPGKLWLRGQAALAEANAAGRDVEDMRLQLIESARSAFYDYYLVARALDVNREGLELLGASYRSAVTRFKTGQVLQQDVFQAEIELGRQRERQLSLERMRQVAVARINTLMQAPPDAPLLPPPARLRPGRPLPEAEELRAVAVARRPDLRALADRLAAAQAALALAYKEFCPDFEVLAIYDAFWQEKPLRPMVGVRVNLPVRTGRRWAAVAEAEARVAQRRAEVDRQTAQINLQVQEALALARENEQIIRLYDATILNSALNNVKVAQSSYVLGRLTFISLAEAQRSWVMLHDRYHEAVADYFRRLAALERAIGGPIPAPSDRQDRFPR